MKREIHGKGEIKLRTKYKLIAKIMPIGSPQQLEKARQRFFLAKKPFNPRVNFIEMAQQEVSYCCSVGGEGKCLWLCSAGINGIRVKFERNFYLSDEQFKAKCFVDNIRSKATCEKIIVRLIRTIKAYGYSTTPMPNQA
jgi:hypothetical protein